MMVTADTGHLVPLDVLDYLADRSLVLSSPFKYTNLWHIQISHPCSGAGQLPSILESSLVDIES